MGKKKLKPKAQGDYPYPSRFGSHSSMMVDPQPEDLGQDEVFLEDEYGQYVTERKFLDTGLMDPHRTNGSKRPRILK